jgi:MFS family permease
MHHPAAALLPLVGVVFIGFFVSGLAMPVLPLHVYHDLGLGTFVVGLATGSQFAAAILSRVRAGRHADMRGAKHAVLTGLLTAAAAGLVYLLSLAFVTQPQVSVTILILGRLLLGVGESYIITGAQTWGLAVGGAQRTGKVIAWMGAAMFASFALGAPGGAQLYGDYGFVAIALATTLVPLVTLLVVTRLEPIAPTAHVRPSLRKVVAAVSLPGAGLAVASVGFGAITAFIALLFAERGWTIWTGFTAFAVAFMCARLFLGHVADKIGGAKVALVCVMVEAVGQGLIWLAPSALVALLGVALTGFGYSLVYPAFGVEALRRAPVDSRGVAMGAYTGYLDVTLALATPALGLIASAAGLNAVFLVSTLVVLSAAVVAVRLLFSVDSRMSIEANAAA